MVDLKTGPHSIPIAHPPQRRRPVVGDPGVFAIFAQGRLSAPLRSASLRMRTIS
jgi:hypothetical protein